MGTKIDLDSLSAEEKARLPGRIRALDRDEWTAAWATAKADRDAAIEAQIERSTEVRLDALSNEYTVVVETNRDPDAVAAAKAAWAEKKQELLASQPAVEE